MDQLQVQLALNMLLSLPLGLIFPSEKQGEIMVHSKCICHSVTKTGSGIVVPCPLIPSWKLTNWGNSTLQKIKKGVIDKKQGKTKMNRRAFIGTAVAVSKSIPPLIYAPSYHRDSRWFKTNILSPHQE